MFIIGLRILQSLSVFKSSPKKVESVWLQKCSSWRSSYRRTGFEQTRITLVEDAKLANLILFAIYYSVYFVRPHVKLYVRMYTYVYVCTSCERRVKLFPQDVPSGPPYMGIFPVHLDLPLLAVFGQDQNFSYLPLNYLCRKFVPYSLQLLCETVGQRSLCPTVSHSSWQFYLVFCNCCI